MNQKDFAEGKQRLLDCLLRQEEVSVLIHEAAMVFAAPIILTTTDYRVIVMDDAGLCFSDPVWQTAYDTGYCGSDSIYLFESEGITHDVLTAEKAYILETGVGQKIPRILDKALVNGVPAAYIGIFQVSRSFTAEDLELAEFLCQVLGVMLKPNDRMHGKGEIHESILEDLLKRTLTSSTVLNDRLRTAGWTVKPVFRCVLLTPARRSAGIDNAAFLATLLKREIPCCQAVMVEEGMLVLLNFSEEENPQPAMDVLSRILDQYDLYAFISLDFRSLVHLPDYYESCRTVFRIAREKHWNRRECRFDDVVFTALADALTKEQKRTFAQSEYKKLRAWDEAHHTDYCRTLNTYIELGCSVTRSAHQLYIHRNTMTKRLERISEISGLDILDGRQLFHFFMTARMLRKDDEKQE